MKPSQEKITEPRAPATSVLVVRHIQPGGWHITLLKICLKKIVVVFIKLFFRKNFTRVVILNGHVNTCMVREYTPPSIIDSAELAKCSDILFQVFVRHPV